MMTQKVLAVDKVNEPLTLTPAERVHSLYIVYTQINTYKRDKHTCILRVLNFPFFSKG